MANVLLSIDWDYFIPIRREWCGSYLESSKKVQALWYKRYFAYKDMGRNIVNEVRVSNTINKFWGNINNVFDIKNDVNLYVTDSHKWSYDIAKEYDCKYVFNIDAHSDLGYEGIKSFMFEVNCSNWLGKLLGNNISKGASILYSPYTYENKDEFDEINRKFPINYCNLDDVKKDTNVSVIHICRSGMWTPPWIDKYFYSFIRSAKRNVIKKYCSIRNWNPKNITLSQKIDYLYCS
ncbi:MULTISPECIES: arginase [Clostridium]|uniref:arginase n=1 Tax=Clostridium TaxID=1485 RepID=UPI000825B30F|nr:MULTISPECIES: arginase [Clostridium]PJI09471.1 arginase [Clostridium sp. CT7]